MMIEPQQYCASCRSVKNKADFNRNRSDPSGLQRWCKDCMKEYLSRYNKTTKSKESKAVYDKSDKRKRAAHRYSISEKGRLANRLSSMRERILHPDRVRARMIVKYAIRRGDLIPMPCQVCGDDNSQSHHDDYSDPLKVKWFCAKHHWEYHAEKRRREA